VTQEQKDHKEFMDAVRQLVEEPRYTLAFTTGESTNTVIESAHESQVLAERLKKVLRRAA
jgi:hypothetical protein